jgi:hypothetical protein
MQIKKQLLFLLVFIGLQAAAQKKAPSNTASPVKGTVWTVEKAKAWYAGHPWIAGANFLPSTAINQLEMWQADSFDSATIDRELGWAEDIGFNAMRVFLHSVAWKQDREGFKKRMDRYLAIADRHKIQTLFVFLTTAGTRCLLPENSRLPKPVCTIQDGFRTLASRHPMILRCFRHWNNT